LRRLDEFRPDDIDLRIDIQPFQLLCREFLLVGVEAALPVIKDSGKVLVFCMEGKRRSVAMAAAILIGMGQTSEQAIDLLTTARKVADPRRWYIRMQIRAFEKYWLRTQAL